MVCLTRLRVTRRTWPQRRISDPKTGRLTKALHSTRHLALLSVIVSLVTNVGRCSILSSPHEKQMLPGEILLVSGSFFQDRYITRPSPSYHSSRDNEVPRHQTRIWRSIGRGQLPTMAMTPRTGATCIMESPCAKHLVVAGIKTHSVPTCTREIVYQMGGFISGMCWCRRRRKALPSWHRSQS